MSKREGKLLEGSGTVAFVKWESLRFNDKDVQECMFRRSFHCHIVCELCM